jgi:hypothetical protein
MPDASMVKAVSQIIIHLHLPPAISFAQEDPK